MNLRILLLAAGVAVACGFGSPGVTWAAKVSAAGASTARAPASAPSARSVVDAAAQAMGGADKIMALRNITAHGYAQYAYMMGGGRISGAADAPEKYIAANDLTRVYDLEHDRFEMRERRNMLFPFLISGGHAYALTDAYLDGDIPWDLSTGGGFGPPTPPTPIRQPRWDDGALMMDGVHMRRMWMMNNPAVLMRALLDPATRLSAPHREGPNQVIEVTLKQGDHLAAGFGPDRLPAWVRWSNPQSNLGQANLTTYFSGWVAADGQGGVLLPLGYQTRMDWRDVDFFKMYVDAYDLNSTIADLSAPAVVRAAPEPPSYQPHAYTAAPIGKGLWRINNGTQVIEFKDHIVIFELGVNARGEAKAVLDLARSLAPGKPITTLITSHNHFDHTAGLREAVAEGLTVIQRPSTLEQFKEMAEHPAKEFPDDLAKNPKPFKSITLNDHIRLQDDTQTLDVYWGRNNGHMADVVFAYSPAEKLIMEGDMVSAAYEWQHWVDTFRDSIAYYHLDVDKVSPVHNLLPNHPGYLTRQEVEDTVKGGVDRARQHCAAEQSTNHYHPGCPVQSKYY
jgi:glyoxylase-like metal-dependent hydrolase (beta-lactamase superfamily II)